MNCRFVVSGVMPFLLLPFGKVTVNCIKKEGLQRQRNKKMNCVTVFLWIISRRIELKLEIRDSHSCMCGGSIQDVKFFFFFSKTLSLFSDIILWCQTCWIF